MTDHDGRRRGPSEDHDIRLARLREAVRTGLWFVPTLFAVGAIVLSVVMNRLDEAFGTGRGGFSFGGGPEAAQEVLSTISSSTLAFTGVVFSITIIALQLASSQFSPRVLRTFLRDRGSQVALGIFVATFVYSLLVLRTVRLDDAGAEPFAPGLSITVAIALVLLSLGAFVYYVNHIAQSIRVVSIIDSVAGETRRAIDENYPADDEPPELPDYALPAGPPLAVLHCERQAGVLLGVDEDDLVATARRHGCVLRLIPRVGDFVASGAPLFEVFGTAGITVGEVLPHVGLGAERTMYQDVAFGFRQLVDIAEKALSPSTNDPTTAVQAVDRLHDLLRRMAARPWPSGLHTDADGSLRLVHQVASWADHLSLAFDEIRGYGAGSLQVARRLRAVFDDLATVVDDQASRDALDRQRRLLDAALARRFPDAEERQSATVADDQGLGG